MMIQILNPDTLEWEWAETSDLPAVNKAWEKADEQIGVYKTPKPFVLPSDQRKAAAKKIVPIALLGLLVLWGIK